MCGTSNVRVYIRNLYTHRGCNNYVFRYYVIKSIKKIIICQKYILITV